MIKKKWSKIILNILMFMLIVGGFLSNETPFPITNFFIGTIVYALSIIQISINKEE